MASGLWGQCDGKTLKQLKVGKGQIVWGKALREILIERGMAPNCGYAKKNKDAFFDYFPLGY